MLVILNQGAGRRGDDTGAQITRLLEPHGVTVRLLRIRRGNELIARAEEAVRSDAKTIVAAGGDGTVSAVASKLAGTGKTLGVLPLGTFNFFARKLSIPLDLEQAIQTIVRGHVTETNLGEVNGRTFVNTSSIGAYPTALREREASYRRFGRSRLIAYLAGAFALLRRRWRVMSVHLCADGGQKRVVRSQFVFVCNNHEQLAFYHLRGRNCVTAGAFAVYTAPPLGPKQMFQIGMRLLLRRMDLAGEYNAMCARDLRVKTRRARIELALDGERVIMSAPLHYRMHPHALRVLVPAKT